jgi:predicted transcriptional regulator
MLDKVVALVTAYVRRNPIDTDQLPLLIATVSQSLADLSQSHVEPERPNPTVLGRRSIAADALTCLECGATLKTMKRHLRTAHGLTSDAYKTKWRLPSPYPMTAANYSKRRSELAMTSGLGDRTRHPRR